MLPCSGNVNAMPRKVSCKIVIGSTTITDIKMLTYSSDWSGNITIGQVVSSYFNCTIPTPNVTLSGANVSLYMGIGTTVEWVLIGTFRIDEKSIKTRQGYTSFSAFDKLYYSVDNYKSSLTYPASLQAVCNEVCQKIGVTAPTLPVSFTFEENELDGYTLRDVLGFIAGYCGKNAYLSPSGAVALRWFTASGYTADGTRANVPYVGENNCSVSRLICETSDGTISAGSGEGIYFTCPFMKQTRLSAMLSGLSLTYRKADVDIPYGNFCIQSGDIITVTTTGTSLTVPVMGCSFTYDGGVSSSVSSYGVSDYSGTANNAERSGSYRRVQHILDKKRAAVQVEDAINHASELITGATGGVMRINMGQDGKPAELLILDTGDISTAQKVFRLNENGLGYSNNGYNGTFETAITSDGLIVTDRFVGNTISGVTLETIAPGTGSRPKSVVENGALELKRVATDETEYDIGVIKYEPQSAQDQIDSLSIRVQLGNTVTIGYDNNGSISDQFIYYSDLSAPNVPSDASKFNFWGDLRIFSNGYWISLTALEQRVAALEQRVADLENQ